LQVNKEKREKKKILVFSLCNERLNTWLGTGLDCGKFPLRSFRQAKKNLISKEAKMRRKKKLANVFLA
jgi:hypothetical protein